MKKLILYAAMMLLGANASAQSSANYGNTSWTADNGNGTFTNPLFYDEFSDPDVIRVGDDYYLAGTTMHCTPGLVVLHSKDLVNWNLASYCFNRWNEVLPDDKFRLTNGKHVYGQGVWAPVIRYNNGTFYVFTNVNGNGLQLFTSKSAYGPWEHKNLSGHIYDLSVLFDDDGKVWAIHGYDEVKVTQFKPDFSGYVEGSERVIIPRGQAMGEGHHAYKINGKYYIISAEYNPMGRSQCARADNLFGPYETTSVAAMESLGTRKFPLVTNSNGKNIMQDGIKFNVSKPGDNELGCATVHQGGMLQTPDGKWWAVSMLDFVAVGRTVCLVPITWKDGWPMFGLEGNPGRCPRTWTKPATGADTKPHSPYQRSDDFNGRQISRVWQWNHEPVDNKWALKNGKLRLNAMPAENFMWARNTLTQRCIGPVSDATVTLSAKNLKKNDVAGLGLLNIPYAWIGVSNDNGTLRLQWMQQSTGRVDLGDLKALKAAAGASSKDGDVTLRIHGDYDEMWAVFSYSLDGKTFHNVGDTLRLPYQLNTFQGSRFSLFCFNQQKESTGKKAACGYAEFDDFTVNEPMADRTGNLPIGKVITLDNLANGTRMWGMRRGLCHSTRKGSREYDSKDCQFRVHDRGNGRVALECLNGMGFVTITGEGISADVRLMKDESDASLFVWQDMLRGECMLLSLKTNRFVGCSPDMGEPYSALFPGSDPNRKNGCVFRFTVVEGN
ncbi:MAG: glycoside hydrolase 43 family protein [Prevotellaceae bacterium]|nr:glycoside hydrolase 43 family protein [Prevotellaceae bacterium]MDO4931846.1 glycoside hydrolase 43 family protein [Prevotellaceae bacterium]